MGWLYLHLQPAIYLFAIDRVACMQGRFGRPITSPAVGAATVRI